MKNLFLISTVLFASLASAAWNDIPAKDYTMADPPAAGSAADVADIDELLDLQKNRTESQCDQAQAQIFPNFGQMYGGVLNKKEIKKYEGFMSRVGGYGAKIADQYKEEYMRDRPYDRDARVQPCIKKPGGHKSYPSGHATLGAVTGCVLASEFPDRANALEATGLHIGDLRAIAGVHHPSDVAAGQDLGRQICIRLLSEPDFRKDLDNL